MRIVTMDDEARDLMEAGMEMAHAALEARARRVDPDGVITKSIGMSRIKCADVLRALRQPPLAEFSELPVGDRLKIFDLCALMFQGKSQNELDAYWEAIRAYAFVRGPEPQNPSTTQVEDPAPPTVKGRSRRKKKPAGDLSSL